jgi:hypothetical protein
MVSPVFVADKNILPYICRAEKLAISTVLVSLTEAVFASVGLIFFFEEYTFITGKFILGIISIGLGFASDGILFLALRALSGIG